MARRKTPKLTAALEQATASVRGDLGSYDAAHVGSRHRDRDYIMADEGFTAAAAVPTLAPPDERSRSGYEPWWSSTLRPKLMHRPLLARTPFQRHS